MVKLKDSNLWWENYWASGQMSKKVPSEHLARFVSLFLGKLKGKRILDIGFGDGKDLLFMLSNSCVCYGIEATQGICDTFLKRNKHLLKCKNIHLGTFDNIVSSIKKPLDFIYSFEALHYLDNKCMIKEAINKCYELLSSNGAVLVSMINPRHFAIDASDRVDKDCRVYNNKFNPQRVGVKFVLFKTEQEIRDVFDIFPVVRVGRYDFSYNLKSFCSHWLITCFKGKIPQGIPYYHR